ncbi:hypothetical protein I302_100176 [Kwoniella bestiolae CBS 10118]|uniref:Uncharacterized protein n=1 Tax=Kwoniella bestiolae CBS 10118 TaxID=1296100 RepID=A0A1B9G4C8_9TREE|nr:hypothetical protein I302_03551 [Kwoniella bestiolae CBS 10118]OCF25876.1 hypothetical protein I302_03551 [Kwoniella bestiolae CBS 10118]
MVRTIREPNLTTPQLLRVSTSSASSSRRSSGCSPSQPVFVKTKTTYLASSPNRNGSTVKKRAVLGEREENIMSPSQPSTMKSKSKQKPTSSLTPRSTNDLSGLSRFVAKSPSSNLPLPTRHDIPSSSPVGQSPNPTFMSRPGSTPFIPRQSIPMQINEDDTLLLNMRPPEMDFSSPGYDLTDDSDVENPRGTMLGGRGGLITPANSQEVSLGSPQRSQPSKRTTASVTLTRNPISRLPTPPSSQSGSYTAALPPTPQAGPSRASRIRARPSPTPPRRISTEPSEILGLGDITTEWDTPLKLGEDVSPNPRRKKSPRLSQPGQTPTRGGSLPAQISRVEVVIPLRARSSTPGPSTSTSNTPATVRPKGKGIVKPRIPNSSLSHSQSQSSRRTSGDSSKSTTTPAASRSSRAVPSTAPAGKGRRKSSTISPKTRTTPPSRTDRRASVPVNTKTPKGRGRKSSAIAQTPKDLALSGRRLGTLARPIRGSPGDDPLLLKSEGDEDDIRTQGIRDRQGLLLSLNEPGPSSARQGQVDGSSPFNFRGNEDDTLLPMGHGEGYFDMAQGWSDDGFESDAGVGEDTFIHVRQKGNNSGVLGRLGKPVLEEEEEEEEERDKTVGYDERPERQRSYTPVLPPRELDQVQSVEEPVIEADSAEQPIDEERSISPLEAAVEDDHTVEDMGDVTLEMEGQDCDVSKELIEFPEEEDVNSHQPDLVHERSPSPVADEDVGDVTQEMEGNNWDVSEEDLEVDQDGDVPPAPQVSEVESPSSPSELNARQDDNILRQLEITSEEVVQEDNEEEEDQAIFSAPSDDSVPDDEQEGDITQEVIGDEWEVSEDGIPQPSVELHQSPVQIESPVPAVIEEAEDGYAKPLQEDISQDAFNDDIPSRTSSPDHVPSLGESEEMGDVTQDMDVLDWDVSEEDIEVPRSEGQGEGRSESPIFEKSIEEESGEFVQEFPVNDSEGPTEQEKIERLRSPIVEDGHVLDEVAQGAEMEVEEEEDVRDHDDVEGLEAGSGHNDPDLLPHVMGAEGLPSSPLETEISRSANLPMNQNQSPLLPSISLTTEASPRPNKQIPVINFPRHKRTTTTSPSPSPAPEVTDISTTPTHSPSFEPRSLRSPSVPKSPFVLIHHRGDLTFTPQPSFSYSNYRSPSPLPPPTPVFSAEERGHAILEEAERALRRLSKLRSLSPLPLIKDDRPTLNIAENTVEGVVAQPEVLDEGERENLSANPEVNEDATDEIALSYHTEVPTQLAVAIDEESALQDMEEEENSSVGDITVEADNSAWNLSTEEYEIPLKDESDGEVEEQEEDNESFAPDENIHQQAEATEEDDSPANEAANQQTAEEEENQDSPEPIEVPERIVLRLVESGIIKLEPESDAEVVVENVPFESDIPPVLNNNATSASSPIHDRPSTPSLSANELRERSITRSPAPVSIAGPSTPSVYPALPVVHAQPESSTPKTAPPPSSLRYANSTPQGLTSQKSGTSKLSQQILPSSPSTEQASSPAQHSSPPRRACQQQSDESVIIRKPRRSLHDELATAAADDDNSFEGDESFRSVVEVSSLDPKAAARAAAILKLNHAYIEHGILPKSKDLASSTKSTSHTDQERRELLNEAELEIVESHRRSRSRSRSMSVLRPEREREMSVMSFMTEDYPVPGAFVRTPKPSSKRTSPLKRKRDLLSVHEAAEERHIESGKASDEIWGVKEWKKLEKVYRREKEPWMKEREIKALPSPASPGPSIPGGLVAWARRSTFGTSAVKEIKVREWDVERVVERFLGDEKKEGRVWDRDMLVLRVQAIERRVSKLASSTASTSTSTSITEMHTPATKRTRPNAVSHDSAVLQTPTVSKSTQESVEPPSTIKRMLGFVWGKSKTKPPIPSQLHKDTLDKNLFATSIPVNNKGKEKEVLPTTQMREIRPPHPASSRWTPVAAPPPPPPPTRSSITSSSQAVPIAPSSSSRPIPILSRTTPSSSLDEPTSITHSTSLPSLSLDSTYKRLYPPLNPPISQRSDAIARLFPDSPSTVLGVSSSTSEKNLKELGQIQKKRSGSVKSLVESWEGKGVGIMGGSITGKDKGKE